MDLMDLLKLVDSRERSHRFKDRGLINEPGMREAATPDENGLWIDVPTVDEARPTPPVKIYGKSSGVIGCVSFPILNSSKRKQNGIRSVTTRTQPISTIPIYSVPTASE